MLLNDLRLIYPEIILFFGALMILIYGIFSSNDEKSIKNIFYLTIVTLFLSLYFSLNFVPLDIYGFNKLIINNNFSQLFKFLVLIGTIIICFISYNYFDYLKILKPEYFFLILLSCLGILIMVSSSSILSMYIGLELQSICLYILASYRKDYLKSAESGVKYFILGALSSGILLYGLSLIYGITNSTAFIDISEKLNNTAYVSDNIFIISTGFVLVLSGLFFKIATVPFHMWAPDVYEGAPTPVTAFFTTIPKIGVIGILIKFLNIPFDSLKDYWIQILYIVSVASMILGSTVAINQQNIKRLLAYSSINHMGFIIIGILTVSHIGIKSVLLYVLIYLFTILGIFACLLCIKDDKNGTYLEEINSFSGLLQKNPFLSFSLAILLFSLAGLPPMAGFFSKLYILISAVDSKLYILAVIAVLTSVISAFYYLKIIKVIFFDKPQNTFFCEITTSFKIIIFSITILTLFFIFFVSDILNFLDKYTVII